ncbi:MAG: DUF1365 domain-containing protein [Pseudomonadota bacterium]
MTVAFRPEVVPARTFHGRQAEGVANAFRYGVDYVLVDPDSTAPTPTLFSRNRANLTNLSDRDHGGPRGDGRGVAWVRDVLADHELDQANGRVLLLAQPRVLGHVFNPVSFWLCHDRQGAVRVIIAEVTNTYGDRHSYLCHKDDLSPITRTTTMRAQKCFYVSPFQPVAGEYTFRFDITDEKIGIWIDYRGAHGRLLATLSGPRKPMTNRALLTAALRRPLGSRRVLALIHWQALRLWLKKAAFRPRPTPPSKEVTR